MMMIMLSLALILFISYLLFNLGLGLSKKSFLDREKLSPFECGFNPKSLPRIPFSIRFFLIAVIFLVFDVELVLIFPFIPLLELACSFNSSLILMFFVLVLLTGLYYEMNQGSLSWAT